MFPEGFDDWCGDTLPERENERLQFRDFENPALANDRGKILRELFQRFNERHAFWPTVIIDPTHFPEWEITWAIREDRPEVPAPERKCDIWNLQLTGHLRELTLTGAAIHHFFINTGRTSVLRLSRCLIGDLHLIGPSLDVELTDCVIGCLRLEPAGRIKRLEIRGGAVADIVCPTSSQPNPFSGSVRFLDVSLPTSRTHTKLFKGPQSYRNLLDHLEKLNNLVTANKIRALQMQAEREDDKGIVWFINWVYGTFASYGTNPGRPITWILGFYVIIVLAAHCGDASSFNASFGQDSALYKTLASPEEGRWHRAWMLPLQSAVNPFGVFFDGRRS